jgi:hypothetical protein
VAPRQVHREMIEFARLHGIKPIIEQFPLTVEGITEAMDRLNEGKRFRTRNINSCIFSCLHLLGSFFSLIFYYRVF